MWSTNETHEKDFAQREQATSSPKPKEPVAKGSVVRLPEPSVTPFKRTVLAWVGINNRFCDGGILAVLRIVRSQRTNGLEISHGVLSNREDSKQAGKYLRKHNGHQNS